jgi:hypothetical protein
MAAPDPAERSELARLALLTRWAKTRDRPAALALWCREHALRLMWLFQLVLPPVAVLVLPAKAQVVLAIYIATIPISIGITWRVTD